MSDAATEFAELMPHRISVRSLKSVNNFGKGTYDDTTKRDYICLVQDEEVITRSQAGTDISVHLTAYCPTIPLGSEDQVPVLIDGTDEVTIVEPAGYPIRPVISVAVYYDETGLAYAQVLRLT